MNAVAKTTEQSQFSGLAYLPLVVFLTMTLPFWREAPSLDAMVLYREATQFFAEGWRSIYNPSMTVHPPLLYLLVSGFFLVFGTSPVSYALAGTGCYALASITFYYFARKHFGGRYAVLAALFIFCNPPMVLNFFHPTNEALLVTGFVVALKLFSEGRHRLLAAMLPVFVFMKETALLVPLTFALQVSVEAIRTDETVARHYRKLVMLLAPTAVAFLAWRVFLGHVGATEWREHLFGNTAASSSFSIVVQNLMTFSFANSFLAQNLRNAFVLNFQWAYAVQALVALALLKGSTFCVTVPQRRFFLALGLFTALYVLLVLSFPTWTIPRYALPATLALLALAAVAVAQISSPIAFNTAVIAFALLTVVANFSSTDPVTALYGHTTVSGEQFYDTPYADGGPDRVHYNLQFLRAGARQNELIARAVRTEAAAVKVADCNELKIGEKLWSASMHNDFYPRFTAETLPKCEESSAEVSEAPEKRLASVDDASTPARLQWFSVASEVTMGTFSTQAVRMGLPVVLTPEWLGSLCCIALFVALLVTLRARRLEKQARLAPERAASYRNASALWYP